MSLNPPTPGLFTRPKPLAATGPLRFGKAPGLASMLGGGVDKAFNWIEANRARELIVEDVVGFGLLRTGMDLFRGYFYGNEEKLNIPMARERMIREVASIATDFFSAGIAAFGIGWLLDKARGGFSNSFIDFSTMELFQGLVSESKGDAELVSRFAKRLVQSAAAPESNTEAVVQRIEAALKLGKPAEQAVDVAKALGQKTFDVKVAGVNYKLPSLLEDLATLRQKLGQQAATAAQSGQWQEQAQQLIAKTLRSKRTKLWGLAAGVVLTTAVPLFNNWLTKKIDGIEDYPGTIGLIQKEKPAATRVVPAFNGVVPGGSLRVNGQFGQLMQARLQLEAAAEAEPVKRFAPYVMGALEKGNPLPMLLTLLPVGFGLGIFDTVKRQFVNPFAKGGLTRLRNMYDFNKVFPFTGQQQVASLFALLISSRLLNSREGNEFRERLVDSGLGWVIWIMATPWLKERFAKWVDPKGESLWKTVDKQFQLRSIAEVESLSALPKEKMAQTVGRLKWIGRGSMLITMFLLGIVEPYVAMMWTKRNALREAGLQA